MQRKMKTLKIVLIFSINRERLRWSFCRSSSPCVWSHQSDQFSGRLSVWAGTNGQCRSNQKVRNTAHGWYCSYQSFILYFLSYTKKEKKFRKHIKMFYTPGGHFIVTAGHCLKSIMTRQPGNSLFINKSLGNPKGSKLETYIIVICYHFHQSMH